MKLVHIKQIKGSRSLYGSFLYIALLPLFLFGIVMMIYSSYTLRGNIQKEVSDNLRNVGVAVLSAYETSYEGDYNVIIVDGDVEFYKGDVLLSNDTGLIDKIKADTGVEISLFFYDTRVLTTIEDAEATGWLTRALIRQYSIPLSITARAVFTIMCSSGMRGISPIICLSCHGTV